GEGRGGGGGGEGGGGWGGGGVAPARRGGSRRGGAGAATDEARRESRLHPVGLVRGALHHGRPASARRRRRRGDREDERRQRDPLAGRDRSAHDGRHRDGRGRLQRRGGVPARGARRAPALGLRR